MDKISIIITSYNRGALLKRAINSVLSQTYANFELIIVDDCSALATQKILDEYESDDRIIIFRMAKNSGANVCRNKGISIATGKFYTGLDDDDFFYPDRIADFRKNFNTEYSFLCDNYLINNGGDLKKRFRSKERVFCADDLAKVNQAGNQVFTYLERIKKIGGFDERLQRLQDQDTWYRLALEFGEFKRIDNRSYVMDISHEKNRITTNVKELSSYLAFYEKHKINMSSSALAYNRLRLAYLNNDKLVLQHFDFDNLKLYTKFLIKNIVRRISIRGLS